VLSIKTIGYFLRRCREGMVWNKQTFTDLIDERRAVRQALLELSCVPAGVRCPMGIAR
jgi:hypothetical protein